MLVLSRKKDETIILKGPNMEEIKITVVRIDNRNKVRIGIEADKEITVLRSELSVASAACHGGHNSCKLTSAKDKYSTNLSIDGI